MSSSCRWQLWRVLAARGVCVLAASSPIACDGNADDTDEPEAPACVEVAPESCTPLYTPTFDEVFARTLTPSCATGGGACHASATATGAAANDFFVDDADATFARLLEPRGDATFVVAGDAACSSLVVRLLVDDTTLRMPLGTVLSGAEICSVAQWIEDGATR